MAASSPTSDWKDPDLLYTVRAGKTTFRVLKHYLEITPAKPYFWSAQPAKQLWSWDSIEKCNLEYTCFSSVLVLQRKDFLAPEGENSVRITGRWKTLREAAGIIFKLIHGLPSSSGCLPIINDTRVLGFIVLLFGKTRPRKNRWAFIREPA
eukprot:TRINITY_DN47350_c0_g1_i3.p1 TRINITY_DN47350_c0_g1~~TRINITY_DN47350_c0_g1_i3.p1  ORF type:complete len:151 (+),score=10.39 TRINITY_DN47350_c0_g1_i3:52-504(+)